MVGLYNDSYWLARFIFERALALIYLAAYLVAANQFRPLLGEHGLQPVPRFVKAVSFGESPSLFHLHYSDRMFGWLAWAGVALSLVALSGLADRGLFWLPAIVWFLLWVLYLSIVNVGQTFYGFGWESGLLEAGFLAIFLGPSSMAAPFIVIILIRWMLFRLEFGAGLIKMRGDRCWRDLTCMNYHYETQPMPNPVSWYAQKAPKWFHKFSVLVNHFSQLVIPWLLFVPQPVASIAGLFVLSTQGWLVISGNYSWLNYLTITLAFSAFSDSVVTRIMRSILPVTIPATSPVPLPYLVVLIALALLVAYLSIPVVRNMISRHQAMNRSFNSLHLVNTYGAFGSVTKERLEVIVEGTEDEHVTRATHWKAYEFKGKPGDLRRRPPIVAPYHWRLDWQMWFLPFYAYTYPGWFLAFVGKLLVNDAQTLKLLARNPFPGHPPRRVRARFEHYKFTSRQERRETGQWWVRTPVQEYLPAVGLKDIEPEKMFEQADEME